MAQYIAVRALNRSSNIRVEASNTVYSVAVSATGGEFKLVVTNQADGNSDTTATIAYNASTSAVKTALTNLTTSPDLASATVDVSGGPGDAGATTPYVISIHGAAGDQDFIITGIQGTSPLTGGTSTATVSTVGRRVALSTTVDTVIDLDRGSNRRALAQHSAIGQYIVTAANAADGTNSLPANT
jgi:hypothetical protein